MALGLGLLLLFWDCRILSCLVSFLFSLLTHILDTPLDLFISLFISFFIFAEDSIKSNVLTNNNDNSRTDDISLASNRYNREPSL